MKKLFGYFDKFFDYFFNYFDEHRECYDIFVVIFMIATSMIMIEYIAFETIQGIDLAKKIILFSIEAILMSLLVLLNYLRDNSDADPKD